MTHQLAVTSRPQHMMQQPPYYSRGVGGIARAQPALLATEFKQFHSCDNDVLPHTVALCLCGY